MSIYLSASSISDFIRCSQKVLYRRTKPFPEVQSKEMIMGIIAHSALEKGWRDKARAYEVIHWEAKHYPISKSDIVTLEFYIDIFFLNFKSLLGEDDLVEYNFKLKLYDDIFLVGKMDRVSKGNIIDWKTGGKIATNLGSDVQCIIYDYAYNKIFDRKPSSICLASLGKGELIPYRESKAHTEELFERIIPRMIKTIKNDSYDKQGMFNHSCFRCPYKIGCLGGGGEETYELDSANSPE